MSEHHVRSRIDSIRWNISEHYGNTRFDDVTTFLRNSISPHSTSGRYEGSYVGFYQFFDLPEWPFAMICCKMLRFIRHQKTFRKRLGSVARIDMFEMIFKNFALKQENNYIITREMLEWKKIFKETLWFVQSLKQPMWNINPKAFLLNKKATKTLLWELFLLKKSFFHRGRKNKKHYCTNK